MEDSELLGRLRAGEPAALETAIGQYGSYVATVIRNRGRGAISPQDVEELTANVFTALWRNAQKIRQGRLRPWLGSVARNQAVDFLRRQHIPLVLETDCIEVPDDLWEKLTRQERAQIVQQALSQLSDTDREIFFRTYDLCQTSAEIAEALHIPASTVRTRLSRGRTTLKKLLSQGGYFDEAAF